LIVIAGVLKPITQCTPSSQLSFLFFVPSFLRFVFMHQHSFAFFSPLCIFIIGGQRTASNLTKHRFYIQFLYASVILLQPYEAI